MRTRTLASLLILTGSSAAMAQMTTHPQTDPYAANNMTANNMTANNMMAPDNAMMPEPAPQPMTPSSTTNTTDDEPTGG